MAHLVIIVCLAATHADCKEVPLLDITSDDVVACNHNAKENAKKWQESNPDYLVIATKCIKNS